MAEAINQAGKTEDQPAVWGMLAEFPNPAAVAHAAEQVRDSSYTRWDVYSPFPIHGIEVSMGLKPSKVSLFCALAALTGFSFAFFMQGWVTAGPSVSPEALSGFRMIIGGKPYFAWEPYMPIIFELTVLFTSFAAIGAMIMLNKLPRPYHPLLKKPRFLRVGDDRFFIAIEACDPEFDAAATRRFLEELGGTNIDEVQP